MPGLPSTTRAFLLSSVDYGESDRVLTMLTEHGGKVAAIARGARKSSRRFAGALESLALIEVTLAAGRGALPRLVEASLLRPHPGLGRSLERFNTASFVIELVRECVAEHEPEPGVFLLTGRLLDLLEQCDPAACRRLALAGALGLLALAGTRVGADSCIACGRAVPAGRKVLFNPGRGGVVCTPCGGGPVVMSAAAANLLGLLASAPIAAVAHGEEVEAEALGEVERAVQAFIERHVARPPRIRLAGESSARSVPTRRQK